MEPNYVYKILVRRVVDGDTIDVDVDLGFNLFTRDRVRLMGIDTPESRTRNLREKCLGKLSKARLKELIAEAKLLPGKRGKKDLVLKTSKQGKGKFGRILGTIICNGRDLNEVLIAEDHARPYFGGGKNALGPWVKEEEGQWWRYTADGYVPFEYEI